MAEIEVLELKDQQSRLEKEAESFLESLEKRKILGDGKNRILLLDEKGKTFSSVALSQWVEKLENEGVQRLVFIVGGAYGFHESVRAVAHASISLSDFTFPHDLAKVLVLEQIYRALQIQAGTKYHHA